MFRVQLVYYIVLCFWLCAYARFCLSRFWSNLIVLVNVCVMCFIPFDLCPTYLLARSFLMFASILTIRTHYCRCRFLGSCHFGKFFFFFYIFACCVYVFIYNAHPFTLIFMGRENEIRNDRPTIVYRIPLIR